ncbi:ABC transporter permease [Natronobacterium texcoconense]|uniref:ABC-type nickel/cobalt efflux system, permease component RcnA n=1 Tax=Natronobacterium texcoconense TaxID=1095778 RepID=A0A1H1HPH7_NATTX|nr:ABC transporter permease [Natronobacterium texcoconense]SDR27259.1 hypothetical protein SAMN04489842_2930 [Natronobacterium texcoconense]
MELGVVVGVIVIGFVHGVLPDHGWPIAAMYALNRNRRLLYGLLAALILGVGHLISSVVLVLAYFWFSAFAEFAEGPWMRYVAGALLILLGIHEYRNGGHGHVHEHDDHEHGHDGHGHAGHEHGHDGHGHAGHEHGHDGHGHAGHEHGHDSHGHSGHEHTDHSHEHGHPNDADVHHGHDHSDDGEDGLLERIRAFLPGGGGHQHLSEEHAERGLAALGTTALLLGFAHEEPIQILAICVGTEACLELMLIYSLAVIVAIVLPTLLLIAGYEHHRERVEKLTPYLPTITAVVLIAMGLAFIVGLV